MKAKTVFVLALAVVIVAGSLGAVFGLSRNQPISAGPAQLEADSNQQVQEAPFSVNPNRFDPYKQYNFKVKWDGQYVPGIINVSGLSRSTEVITSRDGSEPDLERRSPGLTSYAPIVLERGRTHDTAFEDWADKVSSLATGVSLADFRKNIIIELYNEANQKVMAWMVYRCWPSDYVALESFDASNTGMAIESLTLQNEGWERDLAVTEPTEPSFP